MEKMLSCFMGRSNHVSIFRSGKLVLCTFINLSLLSLEKKLICDGNEAIQVTPVKVYKDRVNSVPFSPFELENKYLPSRHVS